MSRESVLSSVDGKLSTVHAAEISVTDEGLLRGDGAYEVLRIYRGRPFALDAHLDRLRRSCEGLRLAYPAQLVAEDIERLLAAAGAITRDLRILITRGGRRILILEPVRHSGEGSLRLRCVTYAPSLLLDGIKSLSYAANMLATRSARELGFDDALLVSADGRVLEAPTASFFWVEADGRLRTPPLSEHILDSITRRIVMDLTPCEECVAPVEDVLRCAEAFLASTTREVQPIAAIDQHTMEAPGKATAGVIAAYHKYVSDATSKTPAVRVATTSS